jgi:hypothetical protein
VSDKLGDRELNRAEYAAGVGTIHKVMMLYRKIATKQLLKVDSVSNRFKNNVQAYKQKVNVGL